MTTPFHVLFIGIASPKFSRIMSGIEGVGFAFSYVVTRPCEAKSLVGWGVAADRVHLVHQTGPLPDVSVAELRDLAALEVGEVPTIHNMIRSDPIISRLDYPEAIAYAAHLARELRRLIRSLKPDVVLGGHDRIHSSMGMAVARSDGIPWYCFNFSTIPMGHITLSRSVVPGETLVLRDAPGDQMRAKARDLLDEFQTGRLKAPAYLSAHSLGIVLQRLSMHLRAGASAVMASLSGRYDRFNDYRLGVKARRYFRKRRNMLRLPRSWFLTEPPAEPFVLFGLHMQPESTPDVFAPFFANQFDVVEKLARAIPPTHSLLIKLHISDADSYSRAQLRAFRQLPKVKLVLPTVSSRIFIDKAAAVATIAGTMGLEASLLGTPVILFGKMNYQTFPTVMRVTDVFELPALVRRQLKRGRASREEIVDSYAQYLSCYFSALTTGSSVRLDDWTRTEPSPQERKGFEDLLTALASALREGGTELAERHVVGSAPAGFGP